MPSRLSRRAVLRGAGGIAVGLPFLSAMLSPLRSHADGTITKRLIVFFTSNGTIPEAWTPTGGETDFQFSPILSHVCDSQFLGLLRRLDVFRLSFDFDRSGVRRRHTKDCKPHIGSPGTHQSGKA